MYTQAMLDALRAAYAKGILEIQYDGQRLKYSTRQDMRAVMSEIESSLGQGRRSMPVASPGYDRGT